MQPELDYLDPWHDCGDRPPESLVGPGSWTGAGTLVGCSGAIEDRCGVPEDAAIQISLDPRQRRSLGWEWADTAEIDLEEDVTRC